MKGNRDTQRAAGKALTGTVLYSIQERNPALAFSMSFFLWGSGQFYNRQMKSGAFFLLLMTAYSISLIIAVLSRGSIRHLLGSFDPGIGRAQTLLVCMLFYLSGMIIGFFNAWQAYYKAAKTRSKPYKGAKNVLYPLLCSLLVPGWGQFLNGQFKKGIFFQITVAAGFLSFPFMLAIYHFLPLLEPSAARHYLEIVFTIWMVMLPCIVLMWILCMYDAGKVCLNEIKKEHLLKRISYISSRVQMEGVIDGLFSGGKRIIMFSLFLILLLIISYNYFPGEFYTHQLHTLQINLSKRQMIIGPRYIDRLLKSLDSEKQLH